VSALTDAIKCSLLHRSGRPSRISTIVSMETASSAQQRHAAHNRRTALSSARSRLALYGSDCCPETSTAANVTARIPNNVGHPRMVCTEAHIYLSGCIRSTNRDYGPTPPLWQSEKFTADISPKSTGCWNGWVGIAATCVPLSCCSITVWQELHSLLMVLPSLLT
jgi:hypothetical protein